MNTALPIDSNERKDIPLARGVLDYFPAALAEVARLSKAGNDKHNPGEDLHWARGKSMDHADCIMRHLAERGTIDTDGLLHDAKVAWRALAMLQEALEKRGAPLPRGARVANAAPPHTSDAWCAGMFTNAKLGSLPPGSIIPITRKDGILARHIPCSDSLENSYGER